MVISNVHRFLNAGHRESYTQSVIDGTRKRDILALSGKVKTLLFMLYARQSADRTRQKIRRDLAKFGRKTAEEGKAAIKLKKKRHLHLTFLSYLLSLLTKKTGYVLGFHQGKFAGRLLVKLPLAQILI